MRVVVAITGASGAAYGVHALRLLAARPDVETHVVVSRAGALTVREECDLGPRDVESLADVAHRPAAVGDTIASGSYPVDGMLVAPCSIKTLSAIANCYADDLVTRAADVRLKEGQPLVLLVRETPLHLGHLRIMTQAAEAGAVIMPPVPAMYAHPETVADIVDHTVRRALSRLGVRDDGWPQWQGLSRPDHAGEHIDPRRLDVADGAVGSRGR